jgi:hypothetical protein
MEIGIGILAIILWVVLLWKIMSRTGQPVALSLIAIVPVIGPLIVMLLIAHGSWPAFNRSTGV